MADLTIGGEAIGIAFEALVSSFNALLSKTEGAAGYSSDVKVDPETGTASITFKVLTEDDRPIPVENDPAVGNNPLSLKDILDRDWK